MSGAKRDTYHHGNLREALIETALELLAERGTEGFTLRECARRLGVSATAASHHFGDVNGLFTAIAVRGFRALACSLKEEVASAEAKGADRLGRLREICEGYLLFAHHNPDLYRITFGKLIKRVDPEMAEASMAAFRSFAAEVALAGGVPADGDPDAVKRLTNVAWAALHGMAMLAIDGRLTFMLRGETVRGLDAFEIEFVETLTRLISDGGKPSLLLDLAGSRS
ncbi:MAG TPA: TetR/AcrR family transcriptional regulator [Acidisphaera sp.]|nr:TetR/AcrR family transcriptional regulator [Acidisphaera sp.]